ncbi:MAG TPA: DUF1080 domain-containing protein, partial [Isosphaeraceae bacterium]
ARAADAVAGEGWVDLTASATFDAWRPPMGAWAVVGAVRLDSKDPRRLAAEPGAGVIYNGPTGRTSNLVTKEQFDDLEVHVEFLVPKGSNSGVKFEGVYEIQIFDSWGKPKLTGSDCGGIYPRAELLPRYHYLDEGHPPRVDAARPPGEWQTLEMTFRAPRFDASGRKVADARFEKVVLNGQVIHEDVALATPTGNNWSRKETPRGPLLFQADHGPVAFRNIRIRPLAGAVASTSP